MIFRLKFLILTRNLLKLIMLPYNLKQEYKEASLRVLHWNCQGARNKLAELQAMASDFDILCLQETILFESSHFNVNGFRVVRKDIVTPNTRGLCTLIKNNIIFAQVDFTDYISTHPSIELQGFLLNFLNGKLLIIYLYRNPSTHTPNMIFEQIMPFCTKFDFFLTRIIDSHNLSILNDGLPTSANAFTIYILNIVIDVSLASSNLAPLCVSSTISDSHGSDHFPVLTHIGRE